MGAGADVGEGVVQDRTWSFYVWAHEAALPRKLGEPSGYLSTMADDQDDEEDAALVRTARGGRVEPLGPAVVAALGVTTALLPLLYVHQNVASLLAAGMSALGSGIAHAVATKVERALRDGLRTVNARVDEAEWAAMTVEARLDWYERHLSAQQVEQVGAIVEQLLRTRDEEKERLLLSLSRGVGAGPKKDDTRTKVIAELGRIGPQHIRALVEVARATQFSVRPGIGGDGVISRRHPVDEKMAQGLEFTALANRLGEPILDALEAAGFVKVDEFIRQVGGGGKAFPSSADALSAAAKLGAPITFVRCTSLGARALVLMGYTDFAPDRFASRNG